MMNEDAPHYVAARVKSRLAEDARTGELGIQVDVRGGVIFLRGEVASARRRALVESVARESARGRRIVNDVTIVEIHAPDTAGEARAEGIDTPLERSGGGDERTEGRST